MRRLERALAVAGAALVAWPVLAPYSAGSVMASTSSRAQHAVASVAHRYRLQLHDGEAVGRIAIPRIRLDVVLFDGTSRADLAKGPGIYRGDYLPGEGRLVYIAGHRTIFGAPFSRLEELRPGDTILLTLPYGRFAYRVTGHRVVPATAVSVLRSHRHEQLILQTCHPRFSASHRYLVYATPVRPLLHQPT